MPALRFLAEAIGWLVIGGILMLGMVAVIIRVKMAIWGWEPFDSLGPPE